MRLVWTFSSRSLFYLTPEDFNHEIEYFKLIMAASQPAINLLRNCPLVMWLFCIRPMQHQNIMLNERLFRTFEEEDSAKAGIPYKDLV